MALKARTKPKQLKFWLSELQHSELKKRARELGYPSASSFARVTLCNELINPSTKPASEVLCKSPRRIGLMRPKH